MNTHDITATDLLRARLSDAPTVLLAAETVVDVLVDWGYMLPSLYLERGSRLRCVAQRGYWQVYDGLLSGAGILGRTYQLGTTQVLRDVAKHDDYIRAIPSVAAEVCVPLFNDGRVVGVLNVESSGDFSDDDVKLIESVGEAFVDRVGELGGPPGEAPAEMLARFAFELACLHDADEIARQTLFAADALSDMGSACLFLYDGDKLLPSGIRGPQGAMFADLPEQTVTQIASYVSKATSSYASGLTPGDGFEATHVLREGGVVSLVVLALVAKGQREGVIVLADDQARPDIKRDISLLELLAATSAAMIAAAGASAALRRSQRQLAHQAEHDPLTGVANRARLLQEVAQQLDTADQYRGPVVLFIDLDGFKDVNDNHGHRTGDELLVEVAGRLSGAARESDLVARIGGDEFIVLCRRVAAIEEATAVAQRIIERIAVPIRVDAGVETLSACVGIAAADHHRSAEDLIAAADRAMYEAKAAGSGTWAVAQS